MSARMRTPRDPGRPRDALASLLLSGERATTRDVFDVLGTFQVGLRFQVQLFIQRWLDRSDLVRATLALLDSTGADKEMVSRDETTGEAPRLMLEDFWRPDPNRISLGASLRIRILDMVLMSYKCRLMDGSCPSVLDEEPDDADPVAVYRSFAEIGEAVISCPTYATSLTTILTSGELWECLNALQCLHHLVSTRTGRRQALAAGAMTSLAVFMRRFIDAVARLRGSLLASRQRGELHSNSEIHPPMYMMALMVEILNRFLDERKRAYLAELATAMPEHDGSPDVAVAEQLLDALYAFAQGLGVSRPKCATIAIFGSSVVRLVPWVPASGRPLVDNWMEALRRLVTGGKSFPSQIGELTPEVVRDATRSFDAIADIVAIRNRDGWRQPGLGLSFDAWPGLDVRAGDLRRKCSAPSCAKIQPTAKAFQFCSGCRIAVYCSRKCQRYDWTTGEHRARCRPLTFGRWQ